VKPDVTAGTKTAHQVFDFNVSGGNLTTVTCNQITGDGTSQLKTATELTVTGLAYDECNVGGQFATVQMNGCGYLLTASEATVTLKCEGGVKQIEIKFGTCTVTIPPQGPLSGLKYHDASPPKQEEITVETLVKGIKGSTTSGCPGGAGSFSTGEYTTGNTILTGETDPGTTMANLWYSIETPPPPPSSEFHCSVEPCKYILKPDGTGQMGHFIFDYKVNEGTLVSTTCTQFTSHGTSSSKTSSELTITELNYSGCEFLGQSPTFHTNGCHTLLTSDAEGTLHLQCPVGKSIQITFGTCTVSIGPQTLKGVKYHNLGTEITLEMAIAGIHGTTTSGCFGGAGTFTTGEITTSNSLLTGQTDPGGVMATVFYE
jgi:hypothetical protein